MAISVVTVAELEVGIHLPSDGRRAERRTAVESIVNSVWVLPSPISGVDGCPVLRPAHLGLELRPDRDEQVFTSIGGDQLHPDG